MIQNHEKYMKRALMLAKRGEGKVSPNPCVGAVVVNKSGEIISEGYHKFYGGPHAEVEALRHLRKEQLRDSTLYVTLEPCCHFGKTPPCVDYIIEKGIKNVVVGITDPNPLINNRGIEKLRASGIFVVTNVLKESLEIFYRPFIKFITKKLPFVTLKVAQSLDGKNSVLQGSRYLASEKTLKYVHKLRYLSDAIMVGVNTIIRDNPSLNIRIGKKKALTKVILDTNARVRGCEKVFLTEGDVIVYTTRDIKKHINRTTFVQVSKDKNLCSLEDVLKDLGERGIQNLLVEGGGTLSFELLKKGYVDRLIIILTPYIIGGNRFIAFEGEGFSSLESAIKLDNYQIRKIDKDIIITSFIL